MARGFSPVPMFENAVNVFAYEVYYEYHFWIFCHSIFLRLFLSENEKDIKTVPLLLQNPDDFKVPLFEFYMLVLKHACAKINPMFYSFNQSIIH